jgi:PAS domain S-box-containing protein
MLAPTNPNAPSMPDSAAFQAGKLTVHREAASFVPSTPECLRGGGETGALMRAHDWALSSLGDPSGWPHTLRTLLQVALGADQPMSIVWGPQRILLYNDRYAEILMRKHPAAVGRPIQEVWSEVWPEIEPLMERAFGGEPTNVGDMCLVTHRRGHPEESHFSFSYTPVRDETGAVAGVFCPCLETTQSVRARADLTAEKARLGELFQQAPGFMCVLRGSEHVFETINRSYLQLVGHRRDLVGMSVREALPEVEGQGFFELLDGVFTSGTTFTGRNMLINLQRQPGGTFEERFVDLVYQPITDAAGTVTGIFVEGYDVTERVHAEEKRKLLLRELSHRVKNLFSITSGMVALSARSAATPQGMATVLQGRLEALARANDLIHPESADGAEVGTTLDALLRAVLLPYMGETEGPDGAAIVLDGAMVPVDGNAVSSVALVFHEMTTNSAKYGALSAANGRIRVEWTVEGADLKLRWEERDGPLIEGEPAAEGFGTKLVKRSITGQLRGVIDHEWRRHGLLARVTIPMERLAS